MNAQEAIALLQQLIAIPSFSKEEDKTADVLEGFLNEKGGQVNRSGNNVLVRNDHYDPQKPTLLLNSHHDTVRPNAGYSKDPFAPQVEDGKLYGLGSNDAGGPLVSLIATFLHFKSATDLNFNIILAATAEEEISGKNGIESIIPELSKIDFAIVGEPTLMQLAVAEKGLMVLDCYAHGKAGHAAREEGENAIYKAWKDIEWFRTFQFEKDSEMLGKVKMQVTQIEAGSQHNVVPDTCHFVVDLRATDAYSLEETLKIIRDHVDCEVKPRSVRLQPSGIDKGHSILEVAKALDITTYGSPTLSDQALMPWPSVKIGPGDSARSHTADEYIGLDEIEKGIEGYVKIIDELNEIWK
ncbi:MAG: M20 family metallo-hydrolase [Bacteroidota bacterium]